MALPVVAKAAKVAIATLKNPKNRKRITGIVCGVIAVILLPIMAIAIILFSLLSIIGDTMERVAVNQSWNDVKRYVESAISGINNEISGEIKEKTYEFMPEFSINLSKAVLNATYNEDNAAYALLYDSAEIERYNSIISDLSFSLKEVKNQRELDKITSGTDAYGYALIDLKSDTAFYESDDLSDYSEQTQRLLFILANRQMPDYLYQYIDTEIGGKPAHTQCLIVTHGETKQIVEYTYTGAGDIYLPEFLALYQAQNNQSVQTLLQESFGEAFNDVAEKGKNGEIQSEEDLRQAVQLAAVDIFDAHNIGSIVSNAVNSGKLSVEYNIIENDKEEKLQIILNTPTTEEWAEIFDADPELAAENLELIEKVLASAGITDLYLPIDSTAQAALFTYFEGFFNLPVEQSALKEDGLLTTLNSYQSFHTNGNVTATSKSYDAGVTLDLNSSDIPVSVQLLPDAEDCIHDILIYDVYDANSPDRPVIKDNPSYTYNSCAVQLAYLIDTDAFERVYGFNFPDIITINGQILSHNGGILTLFVEYSCLDRLEKITEKDIGSSLYDLYREDEALIIGYAHSGRHDPEKDEGSDLLLWHHLFGSEEMPHLGIKTSFEEGQIVPPEYENVHTYYGLSARFIGAKVNPLLWFKAYQTQSNSELLDSLKPKK
ncbi:MAG: hypothetical protein J1E39_03690 [Eubacterium sp.]|nr:hypothetical protein [Eubacterium sp.]